MSPSLQAARQADLARMWCMSPEGSLPEPARSSFKSFSVPCHLMGTALIIQSPFFSSLILKPAF